MPIDRVGFDAVRALRNTTGLGNYARRTLHALHTAQPALDIHLYSPRVARPAFAGVPTALHATLHLPPAIANRPLARSVWRTWRLGHRAARDGVQLYHGLTHEIPRDLPATGIPSVVTFHDLIFEKWPALFPTIDRWSYRWRYRWSAAHATALIAVSEQTRTDLIDIYGADADRIVVIPPPRDEAFAVPVPAAELQRVRAAHGVPAEYLLSVGTLEPRKNQRVLIDALAQLDPQDTPPLVLIGRDGGSGLALRAAVVNAGLGHRVRILTRVDQADLPALVQGAAVFLYPSLMEGFGMPVAEALSAGVPVIAARGGHLNDAGGPGTVYADGRDAGAWASAIDRVLRQPEVAEAMRERGRVHAARFGEARLAARVGAVYDAVLDGAALPRDPATSEVHVKRAG